MSRFYIYSAMLVFIASLPFPLFAGGDTGSESVAQEGGAVSEGAEQVASGPPMVRIESPIEGYQALSVAGQDIDAAYIEESLGERHGAIVLLHDEGEQLESQGVITPLRHQLPPLGWSTLTLALDYPYSPNVYLAINPDELTADASSAESDATAEVTTEEKSSDDTTGVESELAEATSKPEKEPLPPISNQQRIEAALAFLTAKEVERIIFVGHGAGGSIAINVLDKTATPVAALVLVGTGKLNAETEAVFKTFKFPVFDLLGDKDFNVVLNAVDHRKVIMKREGNTAYQKRELIGADHFFTGLDTTLTATINGWLRKRFVEKDDE